MVGPTDCRGTASAKNTGIATTTLQAGILLAFGILVVSIVWIQKLQSADSDGNEEEGCRYEQRMTARGEILRSDHRVEWGDIPENPEPGASGIVGIKQRVGKW